MHLPGVEKEPFSVPLAITSVIVALIGIGIGWLLYGRQRERDPLLSMGPVTTVLQRKYYMDDLYLRGVVKPIQYPIAAAVNTFDRRVIDGAVNGVGVGHRDAGALPPVRADGQRPALRRVPVRRGGRPGHRHHEVLSMRSKAEGGAMSGWDQWAVSLAVFLPAVGAIAVALTPPTAERAAKTLAMVFSGAALAVGIAMLFGFHPGTGLQFAVDLRWIPAIGARYHVGVDGISLPLLELTLLLSFLCAVYSYRIIPSPGRARGFLALMLLLETGMAGTFVAFDLVLFFVFWEMVLVPMYFMIGIWGSGNRQYAAVKFFLYTFLGSVFMLLGFIAMYFAATPHTFDILQLQRDAAIAPFSHTTQMLAFAAVFLGFAVKVPMWPFHTWLPDAHTEAPDGGVGPPGRRPAEDGRVRVHPDRPPDPARRRPHVGALDRGAGRDRDRLRVAGLPGPARPEAADRVLVASGTWGSSCSASRRSRRWASTRRSSGWWRTASSPACCSSRSARSTTGTTRARSPTSAAACS